jgi:hypothetical protein
MDIWSQWETKVAFASMYHITHRGETGMENRLDRLIRELAVKENAMFNSTTLHKYHDTPLVPLLMV